jgi:hypothetical protein
VATLRPFWDFVEQAGRLLNTRAHDLPFVVAAALAALGLSVAVVGGRMPLLRLVGVAGGLVFGAWVGQSIAPLAHLPLNDEARIYLLEGGGALLGGFWPAGLLFAAAGTAVGQFGAKLAPGLPGPIFWVASIGAAAVSLLFFRPLAAVLTSIVGAAAFVFGLTALLPGTQLRNWWYLNPWAAVLLASAIALAGLTTQLAALRGRPRPRADKFFAAPSRSS